MSRLTRRHCLSFGASIPFLSSCLGSRSPDSAHDCLWQLAEARKEGTLQPERLLKTYLDRIAADDKTGRELRTVIELHPEVHHLASKPLSSAALSGIPLLIKDNIETADGMLTTAGSLAMVSAPAPERDAPLVTLLREAGAILFGKTNLSEWANIRSPHSTSGWSARGGLTRHPTHPSHTPSGSSSGSAAAVASGFCAAAIGTETNGSIVSPASACGIVGFKPTLGKISRAGIIPISRWQDTAGPMTRCVRDAALLMDVLSPLGFSDPLFPAPHEAFRGSHQHFMHRDALQGARLGVVPDLCGRDPEVLSLFKESLLRLEKAGATLIHDVQIPHQKKASQLAWSALLTELGEDLEAYLQMRGGPISTLRKLIEYNQKHSKEEMPHFGQEFFELALSLQTSEAREQAAAARKDARRLAGPDGIEAALHHQHLDALICPTNDPTARIDLRTGDKDVRVSSTPSAVAGTPHLTVPMGLVRGLPVGISFLGKAWHDAELLALGEAYEQLS